MNPGYNKVSKYLRNAPLDKTARNCHIVQAIFAQVSIDKLINQVN